MGVGVRHQLVRPLGRGVERDRVVDAVVDRERELVVAAVDRARAGVDEVAQRRQPVPAAARAPPCGPRGCCARTRTASRASSARPPGRRGGRRPPSSRRPPRPAAPSPRRRRCRPRRSGSRVPVLEPGQPGALQRRVVVGVEVVDADDHARRAPAGPRATCMPTKPAAPVTRTPMTVPLRTAPTLTRDPLTRGERYFAASEASRTLVILSGFAGGSPTRSCRRGPCPRSPCPRPCTGR